MTAKLESATAGSPFDWPDTGQDTVLAKCDDVNAPGRWVCLNCRETFTHNMAMMGHTEDGIHVIAWRCSAHGIEQP